MLDMDKMPGKFENRVFIGGNYDHMAVLKEIKKYVEESVLYLFSIDAEFEDILEKMKDNFKTEGFPLSENVKVTKEKEDDKWVITDGEKIYIVKKEDGKLNIYSVFQPILADDFDVPESDIHDSDLRLLHNCKYAIFDVTDSAGEVMELERCKDYGTRVMVVYQAREKERIPDQLSSMILTAGFRRRGYLEFRVLRDFVKDFLLEEDGLFDLYLKVFGYKFKALEASIKINKDRTSNQIVQYRGLEVVNEKLPLTQEGPHFFELEGATVGKIRKTPVFTTNREDIVEWQEDEKKGGDTYYEGNVFFKGGLKKGEGSVDYGLEADFEGDICLTKEEFDKIYPNDEFPYEYYATVIRFPVEILKLKVSFFNGYKVNLQPIAFFGKHRQEDAVTGPSTSFYREENKATFTVKRPKIFYRYLIFWEPMPKEEYEKL